MDREFLREPAFTKQAILDRVLAPHNYDGVAAHDDIAKLVKEEQARVFSRRMIALGGAGTLFSMYNVLRIGQLSPSGKQAALAGALFFSFFSYSAAIRGGFIGRPAAPAVQEQQTQEAQH